MALGNSLGSVLDQPLSQGRERFLVGHARQLGARFSVRFDLGNREEQLAEVGLRVHDPDRVDSMNEPASDTLAWQAP